MGFARSGLAISENGTVEAIKDFVDNWMAHFFVDIVVIVILAEDSIEVVRCV